jgi:hypothetical protein
MGSDAGNATAAWPQDWPARNPLSPSGPGDTGHPVPGPDGSGHHEPGHAAVDEVADRVLARIAGRLEAERPPGHAEAGPGEVPSAEHAIALREQAPELYDLWLRIAQEKAATENYVDRAPYEVPERLAQSGRPRALGALVIVLSFCGYLAWLGGPGPYLGGLIAILDLAAMFGMFFGLRPDQVTEGRPGERRPNGRRPGERRRR